MLSEGDKAKEECAFMQGTTPTRHRISGSTSANANIPVESPLTEIGSTQIPKDQPSIVKKGISLKPQTY